MVNYSPAALDATFAALSDPTRRAILTRLAQGQATVTELAEPFPFSLPAISKHLRVLESAGLLQREIDGRIHRCRLAPEPMKTAAQWIEHYRVFWEKQFDALAQYLKSSEQENPKCRHPRQPRRTRSKSAAASRPPAKKFSPRGPSANS
jgi:DNA-binding transcriptional ArsR family regulator